MKKSIIAVCLLLAIAFLLGFQNSGIIKAKRFVTFNAGGEPAFVAMTDPGGGHLMVFDAKGNELFGIKQGRLAGSIGKRLGDQVDLLSRLEQRIRNLERKHETVDAWASSIDNLDLRVMALEKQTTKLWQDRTVNKDSNIPPADKSEDVNVTAPAEEKILEVKWLKWKSNRVPLIDAYSEFLEFSNIGDRTIRYIEVTVLPLDANGDVIERWELAIGSDALEIIRVLKQRWGERRNDFIGIETPVIRPGKTRVEFINITADVHRRMKAIRYTVRADSALYATR